MKSITGPTALRPATPPQNALERKGNDPTRDREAAHLAEAKRVLQLIEAGGAYCELCNLVQRLLSLSRPIAQDGQAALVSLKYNSISVDLGALRPSGTVL